MAAAFSHSVRTPQWVLTYDGVNITTDVSHMVLAISYVDRLGEASGELEVKLEDHAKRWQHAWYPGLGNILSLQIGYRGEALLDCGSFQVDELEFDGPPDVMTLRGIAAYVTAPMRTPNTVAYENQSLVDIAGQIASKYGLSLVAAPSVLESDVVFARVTQRRETDLGFLKRLAIEHNFDFTVRGAQMVFYARAALEAVIPLVAITRPDTTGFSFRNRTRRIYSGAAVSYFNPDTKQLIEQTVSAETPTPTTDTLKIVARSENGQQALVKAQAALHLHNMVFVDASIEGPGNVMLVAGNQVEVAGWGVLDGAYLIETARHQLTRASGYTTSIAVRRVG
jgi:phage protein D